MLGKDDAYDSKFWKYLESNYKMMKNSMVAKVRRRAGLKDGPTANQSAHTQTHQNL